MLDAAESLIAEGGLEALTVDAVVRRAGTSNGSLYARFGDRLGLLAAVQDRFLDRLGELQGRQAGAIAQADGLRQALEATAESFIDTFVEHRNAFDAFMLQTLSIPAFRERGSQATRASAAELARALDNCAEEIAHPTPAVAVDFVFRTLFALATQLVMFPEEEATGKVIDRDAWIAETTRLLHAYLTAPT
jgi:AcrR family transcriptional regulator